MERRFYALRLLYEGGKFRGFQHQPGMPTVEAALRCALSKAGVETGLAVAARTDAGVHAIAQVVSFGVRLALDPAALRMKLNSALPDGLMVLDAWRVNKGFHARASARFRRYVYLVGAPAPLVLFPYAWSLPDERAFPGLGPVGVPEASRVRAALAHAVGTHDFSGLARPGDQRNRTRTITRIEVLEANWAPLLALVFEGEGFLRAMIRNLVGTAVAAGLGLCHPDQVESLISARERYRGVRAPGWGLTLARVTYGAGAEGELFPGTSPRP